MATIGRLRPPFSLYVLHVLGASGHSTVNVEVVVSAAVSAPVPTIPQEEREGRV